MSPVQGWLHYYLKLFCDWTSQGNYCCPYFLHSVTLWPHCLQSISLPHIHIYTNLKHNMMVHASHEVDIIHENLCQYKHASLPGTTRLFGNYLPSRHLRLRLTFPGNSIITNVQTELWNRKLVFIYFFLKLLSGVVHPYRKSPGTKSSTFYLVTCYWYLVVTCSSGEAKNSGGWLLLS